MSNATETITAKTRECLRCGRTLRSAEAVARGYGAGCWSKIRKAEAVADLSAWTPRQLEDARDLIADGGVVPTAKPGVFRTVGSDGTTVYLTSAHWCGCMAGLKGKACYHRAAVVIVLTASIPAAPTPAPASVDVWAELDRLNEAFMSVV